MRNNNVLVIGNPTIDRIVYRDHVEHGFGGGVYYTHLFLYWNSIRHDIVVSSPYWVVEKLFKDYIDNLYVYNTNSIPEYILDYRGSSRKLYIVDEGVAIPESIIPYRRYDVIVLNPVYREISYNLLRKTRNLSATLAIDIQGFIRSSSHEGRIVFYCSRDINEIIMYPDIIHMSIEEYVFINKYCGGELIKEALRKKPDKIIIVSNSWRGGFIVTKDKTIIYKPHRIKCDETGAGDTLLAAITIQYTRTRELIDSIKQAILQTACMLKHRRNTITDYISCIEREEYLPEEIIEKPHRDLLPLPTTAHQ